MQQSIFRTRRALLSLLLILCAAGLFATPGDIISLSFERSYTKDQISDFIEPLYEGYDQPVPDYVVDVYQLVFESTFADGKPARAYAQVFLPRYTDAEVKTRGLYVFAPGSTGLIDNCRASREHEAGIRWGLYRAHSLSHAMKGSIVIQPDYLGFRDPEHYQQYMLAKPEAAVLLDSIRVMDEIYRRVNYRGVRDTVNFAGGFSQGGHAILAAAELRPEYAPEVHLDGIIGYGATGNPLLLMQEYPGVAPMMVYSYSQVYGSEAVDPAEILNPEYADYLDDDVLSMCVGAMQSYYPHHASELYTAKFYAALENGSVSQEYPGLARVMAENTMGYNIPPSTDILLLQGTDDIVIFVDSQKAYVQTLRMAGVNAELVIYPSPVRHDTRQAGYQKAREWMDERVAARNNNQ